MHFYQSRSQSFDCHPTGYHWSAPECYGFAASFKILPIFLLRPSHPQSQQTLKSHHTKLIRFAEAELANYFTSLPLQTKGYIIDHCSLLSRLNCLHLPNFSRAWGRGDSRESPSTRPSRERKNRESPAGSPPKFQQKLFRNNRLINSNRHAGLVMPTQK